MHTYHVNQIISKVQSYWTWWSILSWPLWSPSLSSLVFGCSIGSEGWSTPGAKFWDEPCSKFEDEYCSIALEEPEVILFISLNIISWCQNAWQKILDVFKDKDNLRFNHDVPMTIKIMLHINTHISPFWSWLHLSVIYQNCCDEYDNFGHNNIS